jgi:hypothetical protein
MTTAGRDLVRRNCCAGSCERSQPLRPAAGPAVCCAVEGVASSMQSVEDMNCHEQTHPSADETVYRRRLRWGLGAFLAIALFFLWEEHRAHLLGVLPWLLLLACPVMHLLMHRRHRGPHG